jgi:hypothetical protein
MGCSITWGRAPGAGLAPMTVDIQGHPSPAHWALVTVTTRAPPGPPAVALAKEVARVARHAAVLYRANNSAWAPDPWDPLPAVAHLDARAPVQRWHWAKPLRGRSNAGAAVAAFAAAFSAVPATVANHTVTVTTSTTR